MIRRGSCRSVWCLPIHRRNTWRLFVHVRRAWCFLTHHRWVPVAQWSYGEGEVCLCRRCGELWNRRPNADLAFDLLLGE